MSESKKGFLNENTNSNDFNKLSFIIRQTVLGLVDTCFVGIVKKVNDDNTVDVLPIVDGVDGNGNSIERSVVYNLPYLRYQGGLCKVDIIPEVGDIGLVCLTKDDSSSAIEKKQNTVPPSDKKFNKSNGIYVMSVASTCEEAKHSLTIRTDGITISTTADISVSCDGNATVNVGGNSSITVSGNADSNITGNSNITVGGDLGVTVTGDANVSCSNATLTASKVTVDSSEINLGGSGGKKIALDGDSVVAGSVIVGTIQATSVTTKSL